jgi:two-component system chemotaxis response regulator CheY
VGKGRITAVVADDDDLMRGYLRIILEDLHIEIIGEASNGSDAVRKTHQLHPDYLFLDLEMPVGDGVEALVNLRKSFPKLTIVIISGRSRPEDKSRALLLGANAYLVKPIEKEDVARVLSGTR